ncbi:MAG: hypothetical protein WAW41_02025 [Methylobacter sp.]
MCNIPLSNKGWLRQYWPQHSTGQLERFISQVVNRLNYVQEPTEQQIAEVRWAAYSDIKGAAK